ncbi:MAG: TusE/DsrC/DsvC family sulfur relay protein [Firmicutes bacterium]|nr:TusE/DsrC/DsvC family sulfur relay protein [Bacillota bacterium]
MDNQPTRGGSRYGYFAGRKLLVDQEGFLWNPEDWSKEIAEAIAREQGLEELQGKHWKVINYMRKFYFENGRAPLNRQLAKDTKISMLEIEALFPGGIKYGARRIAGLPNPKACL